MTLDLWRELDEALVSYCWHNCLTKARVSSLHAAIALALPPSKGHLPWLKIINEESIKQSATIHTLGMPRAVALVIAAVMSQNVSQRIGAIVIIQQGRGLRPSEALTLEPQAISLPPDYNVGMLTLGIKNGTKSGRPEYVLMDPAEHVLEISLSGWLRSITAPGASVSKDLSVTSYTKLIKRTCTIAQLPSYSAHGPRAGFVSDAALRGIPMSEIQTVTRHAATKSLRIYLDTVNHVNQLSAGPVRRWNKVAQYIASCPQLFFPQLASGPVLDPLKLVDIL